MSRRRSARRPAKNGLAKNGLAIVVAAVAVALVVSAVGQWIPDDRNEDVARSPGRVTVDVRNAGGIEGMARSATDRLRNAGFDVVHVGNAAAFDQDSSLVIDRVGDLRTASEVAEVLGIRRVASEPNPKLFVDVTVRLGADWRAPPPGAGESGDGGFLGWLRGLVRAR